MKGFVKARSLVRGEEGPGWWAYLGWSDGPAGHGNGTAAARPAAGGGSAAERDGVVGCWPGRGSVQCGSCNCRDGVVHLGVALGGLDLTKAVGKPACVSKLARPGPLPGVAGFGLHQAHERKGQYIQEAVEGPQRNQEIQATTLSQDL